MSKRLPAIKRVPPSDDNERRSFDGAVKETLEIITGRRGVQVKPLQAGASSDDVVAKVNEVIALLQGE